MGRSIVSAERPVYRREVGEVGPETWAIYLWTGDIVPGVCKTLYSVRVDGREEKPVLKKCPGFFSEQERADTSYHISPCCHFINFHMEDYTFASINRKLTQKLPCKLRCQVMLRCHEFPQDAILINFLMEIYKTCQRFVILPDGKRQVEHGNETGRPRKNTGGA